MQKMKSTITAELNSKYSNLDREARNVTLKNRKPSLMIQSLPKLCKSGENAQKEKKHECAYVLFQRWLTCANWLKTQQISKEDKEMYLSKEKFKYVQNLLNEVRNSIKLELETKQERPLINDNYENMDLEHRLPDIPNDEPQPKENDEIACSELLSILTRGIQSSAKRLLIIDVREEEDYKQSKIDFPENIVHIPAEKIQPNKSPDYYRHLLAEDKEAQDRFKNRSAKDIDIIVLVDSNSSLNTVKLTSPINMLKRSLKECDPRTNYRRIAILNGGFEEWITQYPSFVTDPIRKKADLSPSISNSSLSPLSTSYNFLNLNDHEGAISPILSSRHPAGSGVKDPINVNSKVSSRSDKSISCPYQDLLNPQQKQLASLMANGSYTHSTSISSQKNNEAIQPQKGISDKELQIFNNVKDVKIVLQKIPPIDRSKKPSPLSGKTTIPVTSQLEKELNDIQKSKLQYENQLQKGKEIDWTKEQLVTLKKKEQEIMDKLGQPRNTRSAEGNQTSIYPDLTDLKLGMKTRITRTVKPNSSEEKENIPKPPEKDKIEPMVVDPYVPVTPPRMEVDEEESISKKPLKSENVSVNSTLKRSFSSPNLAQVKKLKTNHQPMEKPTVNRSLKPSQANANAIRIHPAVSPKSREQRFEPVYCTSTTSHPGITGLKNLGNSCYMNSIIQCLSNTVYLAKYFNDNKYMDHLNRNIDKVARAYVAEEVAQVIKALWRGQYKSISPRDLKNVIGQYKMQFENFDQQDSHEFLMFLLDWMHNDLKQKAKAIYQNPTPAETEWEKSMNGQSSVISELFFGQLRSTIECLHCKQNSTTYETFNSLTMSLPTTNKCSLDECVRKFVSGQRVSGWKCPNCKVPRDGMKKFDIAKLPKIIVIHLNRFGETSGWLEKKNTAVDFPLANFNMRQYVVHDNDSYGSTSYSYNLYAMSNHYGTMDGGHYTAYCKSNHQNKWYKYDDHTVSEVQPSTVKNQSTSAYLLFYSLAVAEDYLNS